VQARGVTITTSADPRDVTLDGEVRGQTPMDVHVADTRLRARIPDQAGPSWSTNRSVKKLMRTL